MHIPSVEVHKAASLEEASALLGRHSPDVRLPAGGTDVLVDLKTARFSVGHLIALGGIRKMPALTTPDVPISAKRSSPCLTAPRRAILFLRSAR